MSRKWYHVETGNDKLRDKIAKFLRRNKIVYEIHNTGGPDYEHWNIRVLIYDQRMLDDVNRYLHTL